MVRNPGSVFSRLLNVTATEISELLPNKGGGGMPGIHVRWRLNLISDVLLYMEDLKLNLNKKGEIDSNSHLDAYRATKI